MADFSRNIEREADMRRRFEAGEGAVQCVSTSVGSLFIQKLGQQKILQIEPIDGHETLVATSSNWANTRGGGLMTVCDDEESAAEAVRQALLTLCSSPNDKWNASAPAWVLKAAGRKACLVSFPEPIVVRLPVVSGSESSLLRGRAAHCRALAAERIAAAAEALRYAVEGQLEAQACEDRAEMIEKGREMVSLYREQGIDLANQSQIRSLRSKQLELQTKCNAQDLTIGNYEAALRESLQALPMKQLRAMVSERLAKAPGARLGRKALIDQLVEDLTMQDKEDRGDSLEPSN